MAIDLDAIVDKMAEFESGQGEFPVPDELTVEEGMELGERALAFVAQAVQDTEAAGGFESDQYAQAGFLQGLAIEIAYERSVGK